MRRTRLAGVLVVATLAVIGVPGAALAGGGCHEPMTEADATGEEEATVQLVDACFKASVLRVDPGTEVTFVNRDFSIHNVGGAEWGYYGEMRQGERFTASFADAGVYPFACSYHPGMTGAIVVGDGHGAGSGWTVLNEGPFEAPPKEAPAAVAPAAAETSSAPWVALAAIGGLAIGATSVVAARRATKRQAT